MARHDASSMHARVAAHLRESIAVKEATISLAPAIARAAGKLVDCLRAGNKILACGNGGSAADAQHLSGELLGRFERERPGLAAVALTTDTSTMTAVANDYAFSQVFAKQVRALGRPNDVLVALSTSGNSENVLAAITAAHELGLGVVALTGRNGGAIAAALDANDVEIRIPAERTCRIQEAHITVIHCVCDLIDAALLEAT